jgi:hypothetical protein
MCVSNIIRVPSARDAFAHAHGKPLPYKLRCGTCCRHHVAVRLAQNRKRERGARGGGGGAAQQHLQDFVGVLRLLEE